MNKSDVLPEAATRTQPTATEDQGGPCERCGSPDAPVVCGERRLCSDCWYLYGSCCLEFGADDLWRQ